MMLVRIIEPLAGRPLVKLRLRPVSDYGAQPPPHQGSNHLSYATGSLPYRVTWNIRSVRSPVSARWCSTGHCSFIIGPDETIRQAACWRFVFPRRPATTGRNGCARWRSIFDWQEPVIRAAITLKLCTYEDTGAVMASLTTSIPESADTAATGESYCWLRDAYFVVQALNQLAPARTMEGYLPLSSITSVRRNRVSWFRPYIPSSEGIETRVTTLEGFLGHEHGVRIGNAAAQQVQHDVYGSMSLTASQLYFDERLVQRDSEALYAQLELLGERAAVLREAGRRSSDKTEGVHTFRGDVGGPAATDSRASPSAWASISVPIIGAPCATRYVTERILERAWGLGVPLRNTRRLGPRHHGSCCCPSSACCQRRTRDSSPR